MRESLIKFAEENQKNGTEISKYKKYRKRFALSATFGILLLVATLTSQFRGLFSGLPYSDYMPLLPGLSLMVIAVLLYLGRRDIDINTDVITYHEIAAAINSMSEKDIDEVLIHIENLKDEVKRSENELFSAQTTEQTVSYHHRLQDSQNPEGVLEETFEGFFDRLISQLSEEDEIDEILENLSTESDNEFQGSVVMDSLRRLQVGVWSILTIFAVVLSLIIFNVVGQNEGYYSAIIALTVIQILSGRREG